jgi:hypothetical protein
MKSYIFDRELIKKVMSDKKPYYVIGIDTFDKNNLVYCLARKINDKTEFLISKTMKDEKEFRKEIGILAKIFNAYIFETKY